MSGPKQVYFYEWNHYTHSAPFGIRKAVSWRLSRCANLPQIRFWAELNIRTANRITEWILRFELITIFRVIVRWSHRWGRLGEIVGAPLPRLQVTAFPCPTTLLLLVQQHFTSFPSCLFLVEYTWSALVPYPVSRIDLFLVVHNKPRSFEPPVVVLFPAVSALNLASGLWESKPLRLQLPCPASTGLGQKAINHPPTWHHFTRTWEGRKGEGGLWHASTWGTNLWMKSRHYASEIVHPNEQRKVIRSDNDWQVVTNSKWNV